MKKKNRRGGESGDDDGDNGGDGESKKYGYNDCQGKRE